MITEDLIAYIQEQRRKNLSDTEISSRLRKAGWHEDDIEEGFKKINPPVVSAPKVIPSPSVDISTSNISVQSKELESPKKEIDPYRESPLAFSYPPIVPLSQSLSKGIKKLESEEVSYEAPVDIKKEEIKPKEDIKVFTSQTVFSPQSSLEVKPVFTESELMPNLIPKSQPVSTPQSPSVSPGPSLPADAMITTFSRDILASTQKIEELPKKKSKKPLIFASIILLFIIIGGVAFAMMKGYIKTPSFSFIKKDPKIVLENIMSQPYLNKPYKVKTDLNITIPTFANITNGLLNGSTITSIDKDYFSIHTDGIISQTTPTPLVEYATTIKSSIMKNDIVTNIKYDGINSFVSVPDLSWLFGDLAPKASNVSIPNGQFEPVLALLPPTLDDIASKIDIYKLASKFAPNEKVLFMFKDFINNANIVDKGVEDVKGVNTYHYELQADRASTKELLTYISSMLVSNLSPNQKASVDKAIGSATLSSIEVWIGKDDNMVYKYKASLSVPLGKVLGLEDRGISGSEVKVDWQSMYYDFGVKNNVELPESSVGLSDFMNSISDLRIRKILSSLPQSAKTLRNALGNYGSKSNPTGSCLNPNQGSLFSPVGHKRGAVNAVGNIAESMNEVLGITNGAGSCFSTPQAWAAAFPLASDPNKYLCIDSTKSDVVSLSLPLSGTLCK